MRYSLFLLLLVCSCTYNELVPVVPVCEPDEQIFFDLVQPIIEANCLACHSDGSPNGDFSNYDELRISILNTDLIDRIQRDVNDVGFMPKGGQKLSEEDIEIITNWIDCE